MADESRLVLSWAGPQITGLAVSVLHFEAAGAAPPVAAVYSAFNAYKNYIPQGITVTVPGNGDVIDQLTGELKATWSAAGGGTVAGAGGVGACAKGVGGVIGWNTNTIRRGRKVRGRLFIVPMNAGSYDAAGNIEGNTLAGLTTLANALVAAGGLSVYCRPSSKGAADGLSATVTSARVRNRVAYLSSRRD